MPERGEYPEGYFWFARCNSLLLWPATWSLIPTLWPCCEERENAVLSPTQPVGLPLNDRSLLMSDIKNTDAEYARRRGLSFEQAEGLEALPTQLAREEISPSLKAELWMVIHRSMVRDKLNNEWGADALDGDWFAAMEAFCVLRLKMMIDEVKDDFDWHVDLAKRQISSGDFGRTYGFIQFILRHLRDRDLSEAITRVLEHNRAPFRLVNGDTLLPLASKAETDAVVVALDSLQKAGMDGARQHLLNATAALSEGKDADSVRESIHAIEAALYSRTGENDFQKALRLFAGQSELHSAYRGALEKLYGYAGDAPGVRHSLKDGTKSTVTEREALFVLGVCSSFVTYLFGDQRGAAG